MLDRTFLFYNRTLLFRYSRKGTLRGASLKGNIKEILTFKSRRYDMLCKCLTPPLLALLVRIRITGFTYTSPTMTAHFKTQSLFEIFSFVSLLARVSIVRDKILVRGYIRSPVLASFADARPRIFFYSYEKYTGGRASERASAHAHTRTKIHRTSP